MARFDGMTALLSGATGGFGRRTAERLSQEGANLVLSDMNAAALETLASGLPGKVECIAGDITDEALSETLVSTAVAKFGRLDIAINNAGVAQSFVKLPQVPSDEARRILEIDLLGVFFAMKQPAAADGEAAPGERTRRRHRQHRLRRRPCRRATPVGLLRGQARRGRPDAVRGRRVRDQGHPRERGVPFLREDRDGGRVPEARTRSREGSGRRPDPAACP